MTSQHIPAVPKTLEDARALVLTLANEETALPSQLKAAAIDRRSKDFAELLMAQQSLPARKAEAEKSLVPLELAYAEKQREYLQAKRDEITVQLQKSADREQEARQEVAMAQGQRESTTYEIGQLGSKIKDLSWKADRLGITAQEPAQEEVMA